MVSTARFGGFILLCGVGCVTPVTYEDKPGEDSGETTSDDTGASDDDSGTGGGTAGDDGSGSDGSGSGSDGSGSGSGDDDGGEAGGAGGSGSSGGDEPVPDLSVAGSVSYATSTGSASVGGGCTLNYQTVTPATGALGVRVVMAHGFMRASSNMTGWAEHLASWGFEVVVPTLCHSNFLDTDHVQNAADLISLHAALGGGDVIYMGQSAGGLSAFLAAGDDATALGAVGLDATDDMTGAGASAASSVRVPVFGLVGEASSCNSNSNFVTALQASPDSTIVRVTESEHCDFESPTDILCTGFCSYNNPTYSDAEIQSAIGGMMTAAAFGLVGDVAAEAAWWSAGGEFFDPMSAAGLVQAL